jgi:hypothetical protein
MPADLDIDREFEDLATLLREDRPEIDPFFARELDAKAAAGFPRESRWRRLFSNNPMLVPSVAASMLLALVVGATMLSSPGDDSESASGGLVDAIQPAGGGESGGGGDSSAQQYSRSRRDRPKPEAAGGSSAALAPSAPVPTTGGGSPRSDPRQGRKVETSAALVLAAKPGGVQTVHDEVIEVTDRHEGFVMSSSVNVLDGGGGASLELRVPSDRLKAALTDLSRVAQVRERREAAQDITREFVSARSRLADARADRRGLLRRLARAATEAERAEIKFRLRETGARISAARTDLARVNNRASYSNISVSVLGDPAAGAAGEEEDGTWTPGDAARDAVRVLEVAAGVLLIVLAIALPLALLGALALLLARLTQRRRRERLLDAI